MLKLVNKKMLNHTRDIFLILIISANHNTCMCVHRQHICISVPSHHLFYFPNNKPLHHDDPFTLNCTATHQYVLRKERRSVHIDFNLKTDLLCVSHRTQQRATSLNNQTTRVSILTANNNLLILSLNSMCNNTHC